MSEDVVIQSLVFRPDDIIEIAYAEERDQGKAAGLFKTILVQRELVESLIVDILDSLREVVDEALLAIRNPRPPGESPAPDDD